MIPEKKVAQLLGSVPFSEHFCRRDPRARFALVSLIQRETARFRGKVPREKDRHVRVEKGLRGFLVLPPPVLSVLRRPQTGSVDTYS